MGTTKECRYFELRELLPPEIYYKLGEEQPEEVLWPLIDDKLKAVLDCVRGEIIQAPMICNTWHFGGAYTLRGLRPKDCPTGAKNSQHKLGRAADLVCYKYTAEQMRKMIYEKRHLLPYPVRIEEGVSWLHIDVKRVANHHDKVYFFKA